MALERRSSSHSGDEERLKRLEALASGWYHRNDPNVLAAQEVVVHILSHRQELVWHVHIFADPTRTNPPLRLREDDPRCEHGRKNRFVQESKSMPDRFLHVVLSSMQLVRAHFVCCVANSIKAYRQPFLFCARRSMNARRRAAQRSV